MLKFASWPRFVNFKSYTNIFQQAAKFARVLVNCGVKKGDRVVIYMPMVPEVSNMI